MKKITITALSIAIALLFGGCSADFLNTESTQDVDQGQIFESTAGAMMAVNGLHKLMHHPSLTTFYAQGGYETFMIWMEVMGEDLVYTYSNTQFQSQAKWTLHRNVGSNHLVYHYRLFYYISSNANMIIDNIDNASGTQDERDYIKGQALSYRAFAYHILVQAWAERYKREGNNTQPGVILRADKSMDNRPRASVEEVYTQINKDLDAAIALLAPLKVSRLNKSHIDVHVARGLKARVLLAQGKWKEAAEMAKLVVDNSGAKLQADTYVTKKNRMSDQNNTEWLWGKKSQEDQAGTLRDFHSFMSNMNVSFNRNTPRAIYNLLYNRIADTDVRKTLWFPDAVDQQATPRPVAPASGRLANYMANKFLLENENAKCGDVPYMRVPEMMLIMAEGYARAGEHAKAADALYPLARHRDPQYVKSAKTGEALIDEIMFQRRVELWGEGFRFFDLKRLDMPLDRGPAPRPGYSSDPWLAGKVPTNVDPEASNFNMYESGTVIGEDNRRRPAGHKEWQFLFPNIETDINPLCEQNPL